jgi:hypothetical protein
VSCERVGFEAAEAEAAEADADALFDVGAPGLPLVDGGLAAPGFAAGFAAADASAAPPDDAEAGAGEDAGAAR